MNEEDIEEFQSRLHGYIEENIEGIEQTPALTEMERAVSIAAVSLQEEEDRRLREILIAASTDTVVLQTGVTNIPQGIVRPQRYQPTGAWVEDAISAVIPNQGWMTYEEPGRVAFNPNPRFTVPTDPDILIPGQRWWHRTSGASLLITGLSENPNDGYATVVIEGSDNIIIMYESEILRDWTTIRPPQYVGVIDRESPPRPIEPRVKRMGSFLSDKLVTKAMRHIDNVIKSTSNKQIPTDAYETLISILEEAYTEGSMEIQNDEDV